MNEETTIPSLDDLFDDETTESKNFEHDIAIAKANEISSSMITSFQRFSEDLNDREEDPEAVTLESKQITITMPDSGWELLGVISDLFDHIDSNIDVFPVPTDLVSKARAGIEECENGMSDLVIQNAVINELLSLARGLVEATLMEKMRSAIKDPEMIKKLLEMQKGNPLDEI